MSERAPNMGQVMKMFEEILLKQQEESQRRMEAMLDNFAGMQAEISILESFTLRSMEKFIYQYERINENQRKYVMLRQKLGKLVYKQMECLGCLSSNDEIINAIKKKIIRLKVEDAGSAEGLIRKQVVFKKEMDEEEAVEVLFQEVEEVLSLLPSESRRKPRKIAKAIFDLLPKHIWVRYDDLNLKPELEEADREALKKYILSCIPPRHVRKELKKHFSNQDSTKISSETKSEKEKMPLVNKKVKYVVKAAKPASKQSSSVAAKALTNVESEVEQKAKKYFGVSSFTVLDEVPEGLFIEENNDLIVKARKYFGTNQVVASTECSKEFFMKEEKEEVRSVTEMEMKTTGKAKFEEKEEVKVNNLIEKSRGKDAASIVKSFKTAEEELEQKKPFFGVKYSVALKACTGEFIQEEERKNIEEQQILSAVSAFCMEFIQEMVPCEYPSRATESLFDRRRIVSIGRNIIARSRSKLSSSNSYMSDDNSSLVLELCLLNPDKELEDVAVRIFPKEVGKCYDELKFGKFKGAPTKCFSRFGEALQLNLENKGKPFVDELLGFEKSVLRSLNRNYQMNKDNGGAHLEKIFNCFWGRGVLFKKAQLEPAKEKIEVVPLLELIDFPADIDVHKIKEIVYVGKEFKEFPPRVGRWYDDEIINYFYDGEFWKRSLSGFDIPDGSLGLEHFVKKIVPGDMYAVRKCYPSEEVDVEVWSGEMKNDLMECVGMPRRHALLFKPVGIFRVNGRRFIGLKIRFQHIPEKGLIFLGIVSGTFKLDQVEEGDVVENVLKIEHRKHGGEYGVVAVVGEMSYVENAFKIIWNGLPMLVNSDLPFREFSFEPGSRSGKYIFGRALFLKTRNLMHTCVEAKNFDPGGRKGVTLNEITWKQLLNSARGLISKFVVGEASQIYIDGEKAAFEKEGAMFAKDSFVTEIRDRYSKLQEDDKRNKRKEMTEDSFWKIKSADDFFTKQFDGFINSCSIYIADKINLYNTIKELCMKKGRGVTAAEMALQTGLNERVLKELMLQQAAAKVLKFYDGRFSLNPDLEDTLLSKFNDGTMGMFHGCFSLAKRICSLDKVLQDDKGATYADQELNESVRRMHSSTFEHVLYQDILSYPVFNDKFNLKKIFETGGLQVLDFGCGEGEATIRLASKAPKNKFVGFDISEEAISAANRLKEALLDKTLEDRVSFFAKKENLIGRKFDLIFCYDLIHDTTKPVEVLKQIREFMDDDGVFICVDVEASESLEKNVKSGSGMYYGYSIALCLQSGMSEPGGAALGILGLHAKLFKEFATQAGFKNVEYFKIDLLSQNIIYACY
eukprot:augustus_masked-scaffold_15-processed-gene-6.56-mRNA-1 protein AED:1.00 eAED:1.00 QI:0/0/0/0/1/1/3/0/1302